MSFSVVQPPKDEAAFAKVGQELVLAAKNLGLNLDTEGFLFSWTSGTRVVVQRDSADAIVSFALVTIGKRWVHSDFTASVLEIRGNREPTLNFIKTISNALGATSLFIEEETLLEETPELRRYVVQEIKLQ